MPKLGADVSQISVSGLSSGAYMAGQYHFAHSTSVMGAGIVAGGPYGCAESLLAPVTPLWPAALAQNLNRATSACTATPMAVYGVPDSDRLARIARERARKGLIDPISGLGGDRVYLFTGLKDSAIAPLLVRKTAQLYETLGVKRENIALVENENAGHAFLTEDRGNACGTSGSPYLNDCDYDQAGAILNHILGPLQPPAAEIIGKILKFDQSEFSRDSGDSLDPLGAVFIPESCARKKGCRVHVAFHGCRQGHAVVADAFIEGAGYNRWAEANRIIMLYPQATKSTINPLGCWDWWGYTGPNFLTRKAPQISAVHAMVQRLGQSAQR